MKTLEVAQFGIEELTNGEMINNHGGGDSTSLLNIGSIAIGDLVDVSGNNVLSGDNALFSGNSTSLSTVTDTLFSFVSGRS
ncbi:MULTISPECIES: hypothetical protein [Spirosoma]|uniref:Bacteriocin n=1 Tax=Spirosoma sordidisoli TaxID=2502893 RepID=A0A4Q2UIB8_9BACT|nr:MULTISPECIES: hypothetical protein [Spirosoma]RYC67241.1 hypothetical protein EQG79_24285 [Spirosoma sordidisoli]